MKTEAACRLHEGRKNVLSCRGQEDCQEPAIYL